MVDFYVMPSKGEGYPLILGRPWLMKVNANQKWRSGKLVLQKGKRIVYDMKLGKQSNICFETSTNEESSDESSYGDDESYTSEESSMEVMGLVFQQPQAKGLSTSKEVEVVAKEEPMLEERFRNMLAKDLTKEEEEDYINMFKKYPHLFITDYSMIKGVDVIQHHIDLKPDAKPVAQKLRRLGVVQQEALLFEVNKLLNAGFIYPITNFEWVSPAVVTPKKNGKWRVCVDYKPLNAATKRDHFPLPFQDEILNEVAGHERYTICDGYSGYYQIRIAEEDHHKTTFITPWGCFAFRVMPFGLTNAQVPSLVEEGLQRLYQYGGQLNPDKCHVAEKEVVLLGHVISQEGIKVDPSRVQAILDLPPPNSARQVITFVQKVRYMSRFIHLLSQIISPLQQLANQEVFSWEQEHLECFNEVKEVLGSLPTIMLPDPQGIYYLCPSVGLDAFGAVLMQKDPKTAYMRPIYFTSKVMTQGQKGYTDIDQLVFSLIVAIRKFRSYLLPKPFIILTLEHNLPYAIQHMSISSKISKWVLELQEYEYTFIVEDSTRASLADVLTYKVKEKKITPKATVKLDLSPQGELEDAYTLLFDGAYRRQRNKAAGGFVILNEEKKEVLNKGIQLHLAHSNNEAEYATLKAGLEECKSMGIRRLMVKGDALLIVRQVQGTWACKNSKLLQWLHEVKLLMKDSEAIQIQHISRQHNKEADNMANSQFEVMVGAIKFKEPLFQGQETMEDILYFLEIGECPKHLERVQRHCLVRKALSYQLIEEHLYHKGKDLVLRRVPLVKEIEKILMSCHDGVCGGHFAQEITSRKILQAGFVWPSLHRDVQHWCKACKACQQVGDRKLSYGPRFPIFAYGPFEKWGIDAIGPLSRTSTGKQYILTATDYMTRWAEAASVARITAADVSKFVLDYICSRFGTPLEILSDRGPGGFLRNAIQGEGYHLILGRPWLMEVNADQKWGSGKLVLQKGKRIVYDMKLGKQSNICFETSTNEDNSDESSYGDEESYTSEESSIDVMGLVFQQHQAKGSSTEVEVTALEEPMLEKRLRKMLAKDLTKEEEEDYINMFKRVFLDDFCTYSDRALHCQRIEEGLQRLYQFGGQLNPDKCHVAKKEVVLLGHVISQEGKKVDPSRVQAILDLPPPNSAPQVITFVQKLQEYEYTFIVEDSTRAILADVLTYKVKEKKITPKAQSKLGPLPQGDLEDAYTLLFDGAYRRQRNKAAGRFVILNEDKKEVLKKGIQLHLAHSNNEAEYATLKAGLEECKSMGLRRLMVKGDALLIVKHVQGTWTCKNSKLLQWLYELKLLMKDFEAI
ncbi:hypothetical protein L7F22_065267 [Adiantum nelumboides]|nr:hypothetical protein [Adiantum nelumboides]